MEFDSTKLESNYTEIESNSTKTESNSIKESIRNNILFFFARLVDKVSKKIYKENGKNLYMSDSYLKKMAKNLN